MFHIGNTLLEACIYIMHYKMIINALIMLCNALILHGMIS